jgi:hypothetical protein
VTALLCSVFVTWNATLSVCQKQEKLPAFAVALPCRTPAKQASSREQSLGFVSGEVVFEKEGSGKES